MDSNLAHTPVLNNHQWHHQCRCVAPLNHRPAQPRWTRGGLRLSHVWLTLLVRQCIPKQFRLIALSMAYNIRKAMRIQSQEIF